MTKTKTKTKLDASEAKVLTAHDKGELKSVATEAELAEFMASAPATSVKSRRANARTVAAVKVATAGRSSPASLDDF
jgi:hypothetical protein